MTRRPGDKEPEPEGGRAAERLREFLDQRFLEGGPMPPGTDERSKGSATGGRPSIKRDPVGRKKHDPSASKDSGEKDR
jgi:hypothetical protein